MARIFSGIQPSGELHIGNYLGAVKNWVEMQHEHESFICVVDYHAITQQYDPSILAERTREMTMGLLAAGIDPAKSVLFVQSHVAEHTELAWVFTSVTPIGELERMTQFKDKSQREGSVLAGLLSYPILQAADVLLYKADLVPVGEDQVQHVELMREIVRKWNARYAPDFFPEPKAKVGEAKRILGLDGQAKMSKSLSNPAKTDPARVKRSDPGTPELCNLYELHRNFSPQDTVDTVAENCRTAGWGCLDCKRVLADNIAAAFAPMRERAAALKQDPNQLEEILTDGATKARVVARETMAGVREAMGLIPSRERSAVSS
jgi:tryptophanyl-tRNA synthetase